MNIDIFNKVRNGLTEYKRAWKWINMPLLLCYISLPRSWSQVAGILLYSILKNKMYGSDAKDREINEEQRIYSYTETTIEDILKEINPVKYPDKNIENDKGNLIKIINDLDNDNVFYYWRYRGIYMFIMERDSGVWKYYNSKGCVIPKTMRKIISVYSDMILCMIKFVKNNGITVDRVNIGKSFGKFINKMIKKMNPDVANKVKIWNGKEDIHEYLKVLKEQIKDIKDFEGLNFDDNIITKFPCSVSAELERKMLKEVDMKKEPMNELIPKNKNIVKVRGKIGRPKKEVVVVPRPPEKPQALRFGVNPDPFRDAPSLMRYYRSFLQDAMKGKVRCDNFESDAVPATEILDKLAEHHRKDKVFLNAWLKDFCDNKLKGDKAIKIKYTSMRVFKETFDQFNLKFRIPENIV